MEEILYQLRCSLFHYLQGFTHPRWCRISETSTVSINQSTVVGMSRPDFECCLDVGPISPDPVFGSLPFLSHICSGDVFVFFESERPMEGVSWELFQLVTSIEGDDLGNLS